jgi:hypothetical protein
MYFPPPRSSYEDANTLPLEVDGGVETFTQAFKYLGSLVTSNLDDSAEARGRPQFHFGHGLARDLTNAGVDIANVTWHQAAAPESEQNCVATINSTI